MSKSLGLWLERGQGGWRKVCDALTSKWGRVILAVVLCVGAMVGGVKVRRAVLDAQRVIASDGTTEPLPFTLESALAFRRVMQCYRDGSLPDHDPDIEYPEGINPRANDTALAAAPYALAARLWPGSATGFEERLRWLSLLWWTLSIPALFVAVKVGTRGSTAAAAMATALYAVAISAVARSMGQELSHENDAWPFLMAHVACWVVAAMSAKRFRWRVFWGCAGAASLALALCLWDLTQYYLGAVAVFAALRALVGRLPKREAFAFHVPLAVAVLAVAVFDPYHRAHHLLISPLVALLVATPLTTLVHSRPAPPHHAAAPDAAPRRRTFLIRAGLLILLPALAALTSLLFFRAEAYGHFFSLLMAKLRFLNQRPLEPGRLTFAQRVLWVPALNSLDSELLQMWFPAILWPSTLVAILAYWPRAARFLFEVPPPPEQSVAERISRGTAAPQEIFLGPLTPTFVASFHLLSFVTTVLFARFHIFLAVTACALTAVLLRRIAAPGGWRGVRILAAAALFGVIFYEEAAQTFTKPQRWGHQNPYMKETDALIEALKRDVTPDPVLAMFGVSSSIAAYAECPILLQPKFESPAVRHNTEDFWKALFKGDEEAFVAYMRKHRMPVYVHSMGQLANLGWELSPRYMVDALEPPPDAVVRIFEGNEPEKALKHLVPVYANRKYRIFRLRADLSDPDSPPVLLAEERASQGFQALADGQPAAALAYATLALRLCSDSPSAQGLMRALTPEQRTLEPDENVMRGL